jgi:hypothetical protein
MKPMDSIVLILLWSLALLPLRADGGLADDPPSWAVALFREKLGREYERFEQVKPSFLTGDFNGDGEADVALLVREKGSGKVGIAIVEGGKKSIVLMGAGKAFGNGGDDFNWMDLWSVRHTPRRDQLNVEKREAASAVIYWNGARYRWRQGGD